MEMNASFMKRLLAYLIDTVIVAFLFAIVVSGIKNDKISNLQKQLSEVQNKYLSQEITGSDYLGQMAEINYDLEKSSVLSNTIYVIILIGYFGVFQFWNNGQTLGKKIMKIKVVENDKRPSFMAIFVRSFIINQIFVNILSILLVFTIKDYAYYIATIIISLVNMLIILVSALMILYRKDKVGLHDMVSHTRVVEV